MELTFETENFGTVTIKNVMLGTEIRGDDFDLIEIFEYYSLEDLTYEKLEKLIEDNL